MHKKLLEKINEFDTITIFRHLRPDGDAAYSQMAFYYYLKDNFPNKKIHVCGNAGFKDVIKLEQVSDKTIANSLAIILDTATSIRADDDRFQSAKYKIKIDHHPRMDDYGDLNIVKPTYASTSEILGEIFLSRTFSKLSLSNKVCEYLYCGILIDSQAFSITTASHKTLHIASKLAEKGKLQISELYQKVMNVSLDEYLKTNKLRNHFKFKDRFGYAVISKEDLNDIGMDFETCKGKTSEFSTIDDIKVWCIWIFNEKTGLYDASARSRRGYTINTIAENYNGGGHNNAVGMKNMSPKDIKDLINIFSELSIKC